MRFSLLSWMNLAWHRLQAARLRVLADRVRAGEHPLVGVPTWRRVRHLARLALYQGVIFPIQEVTLALEPGVELVVPARPRAPSRRPPILVR